MPWWLGIGILALALLAWVYVRLKKTTPAAESHWHAITNGRVNPVVRTR